MAMGDFCPREMGAGPVGRDVMRLCTQACVGFGWVCTLGNQKCQRQLSSEVGRGLRVLFRIILKTWVQMREPGEVRRV